MIALDGGTAPILSIVTPSLNHRPYLEQTIESVLHQDYPYVEHVIVDGGSTDGTVELLRSYGARYPERFRWISEKDEGQSDALNKGIAMARGAFIGWQNADDYYLPNVFAQPVAFLIEHPDVAVVFSQARVVDETGVLLWESPGAAFTVERLLSDADVVDLLDNDFIATHSAFIRRSAIVAAGGLARDLHYAMDYDLWLRMVLQHRCTFAFVPGMRGVWRLHPGAKSVAFQAKSSHEVVRIVTRIASDPLLAPRFQRPAQEARQRHIYHALVQDLAAGASEDAAAMLHLAVHTDPPLAQWDYLCRQVLLHAVDTPLSDHDPSRPSNTLVPGCLLRLLSATSIQDPSYGRKINAAFHLCQAFAYFRQRHGVPALPHLLRAIQVDRWWIGYLATSDIAVLRVFFGARSASLLFFASRAVQSLRYRLWRRWRSP